MKLSLFLKLHLVCLSSALIWNEKSNSLVGKSKKTGQQIFLGFEIGLPYDLANTLDNPLGRALSSLSVFTLAALFFISVVWVPMSSLHNSARSKRDDEQQMRYILSLDDGILSQLDAPCRKRAVIILWVFFSFSLI